MSNKLLMDVIESAEAELNILYKDRIYFMEASQDDEELTPEEQADAMDTGEEVPAEQMPAGGQPNAGMPEDPNAVADAGVDPTTGMPISQDMDPTKPGVQSEPPKTENEIGRIFELKKIYARLISAEKFLSSAPDSTLLKLRKFISKSIELFNTMISNIDAYKENIDDIIVMYYKFLDRTYYIIRKYYKIKQAESSADNNKK